MWPHFLFDFKLLLSTYYILYGGLYRLRDKGTLVLIKSQLLQLNRPSGVFVKLLGTAATTSFTTEE